MKKIYIIKRIVDSQCQGYVQDYVPDNSYWFWGEVPFEFDNLEEAKFVCEAKNQMEVFRGNEKVSWKLVERSIKEKEITI